MRSISCVLAIASALTAQVPVVGQEAPGVRLNDHEGNAREVPVGESWTVLAFFPRAATPG